MVYSVAMILSRARIDRREETRRMMSFIEKESSTLLLRIVFQ